MSTIKDKKLILGAIAAMYELEEILSITGCKDAEGYLKNTAAKRATASVVADVYEAISLLTDSTRILVKNDLFASKELRNKLVHSYGSVDQKTVWYLFVAVRKNTIKELKQVLDLLDEQENSVVAKSTIFEKRSDYNE